MQSDSDDLPINVDLYYAHAFKKDLNSLSKRYLNIRTDIEGTLKDLEKGIFAGDPIPGACSEDYTVYKLRLKNSDIKKGKSAGYRFIYFATKVLEDNSVKVMLISIYSKSLQSDISVKYIRSILKEESIITVS
ncbi:type II toxin-antitoxin system RelE/ParE family toxin [Coleofasciculus sp. FACHB-T130]|uniref:type II toxin-antitoxin system RelE/ParE family toxin n=1 Tax=Cyanophyceae TaxID=3028117 RepID=UPI0016826716|nr:type II toxin-antitoxin system RelE/ParE family toxin [Coleofasciculus sp. FACHB-T130]MBD1878377.1 type II toxin-antitoxin system RelE/ParE family toxin [Coleofasciculus sp. FACHB-T130]